jgi:CMP-N-acetylneuraminic acid synthetase
MARAETIAMIPARKGSKRVKNKNTRLLNGKPLIQYSIESALKSNIDKVYVNSDSDEVLQLAERLGAIPYLRDNRLSGDDVTQDEFIQDFLTHTKCDNMILVNPVCPLTTSIIINNFINFIELKEYDVYFTTIDFKLHAFFNNTPLNFDANVLLPPTQLVEPVKIISWNLACWNREKYLYNMHKYKSASTRGTIGFFTIDQLSGIKISQEEDFVFAENIVKYKMENVT